MYRAVLATITLLLVSVCSAESAETTRVVGYIGSHKIETRATMVCSPVRFPVNAKPDYLAITEVYPDIPDPVHYQYTISADGIQPYDRSFRSVGFGKLTYFIKAGKKRIGDVKITNRYPLCPSRPVLIVSVIGVSKAELSKLLKSDKFTIMGLLGWGTEEERDRLAGRFAENVRPRAEYGIGVGLSCEIRYANQDSARVAAEIADSAEIAGRYKLPMLLGLVSWWSGTPLHIDDGAGGKFGDVKYQQICYAPDTLVPENADLKKLLGSRYDQHYRLSIPNQWSNTPWLTMNCKELNAYRFKRLDEALGLLKQQSGKDTSWIAGVYLENEPRYWDTQCEAGGNTLWADFNPYTVGDAKNDAIDLDPSDGLSNKELSWLHRNVSRYVQQTVDAYASSAKAQSWDPKLPLYTHSLQLRDLFPGASLNHPASEWAYALGARSGIEGMYTMPSDFYRLREWGKWADVNREENDGQSLDWHLWDLRVAYMSGADLYNSYNWHAIGAERFFAYAKEFLVDFPVVKLPPTSVSSLDRYAFKMKAPMKLQAFSRMELPIKIAKPLKGSAYVGIVLPNGKTTSSEYTDIDLKPGERTMGFDFTTPGECRWQDEVLVVLYAFDATGRTALDKVGLNPEAQESIKLALDLRTQRALSLAVIARAEASRRASGK